MQNGTLVCSGARYRTDARDVGRGPAGWSGVVVHEVKFDGYRAVAIIDRATITIRSRRLNNLTAYPAVVAALSTLKVESAVDGEIVAVDASGRPNFQALQNARTANVVFYA